MGIPGLTGFMEKNFLHWRDVDLKTLDRIIIGGSSICCTLYKRHHFWGLGGDLAEFHQTVEKFFTDANFKKPIVVFDGIRCEERTLEKEPELQKRRSSSINEMNKIKSLGIQTI